MLDSLNVGTTMTGTMADLQASMENVTEMLLLAEQIDEFAGFAFHVSKYVPKGHMIMIANPLAPEGFGAQMIVLLAEQDGERLLEE